jgi:hypothetical protein
MKTIFVLSILALMISRSPSFGQGSIQFDNYNLNEGIGFRTTYGVGIAGYPTGFGLTSDWTAGLLYSLTPISETATTSPADAAASLNGAWSVASITAQYGFGLPGFFNGPSFVLPGGVEGQIVYFEVIAFQTGTAGAYSAAQYANSTIRGHSAAFTGVLYGIAGTMDNMGTFQVFAVPEPGILGIVVFGGILLLGFNFWKAKAVE